VSQEIWCFKYAPQSLDEMILSDDKKEVLKKVIKECPNVLLAGKPGTGKGTFMDIFLKETGYDFLKLNMSDENSVDTVRDTIKTFATSLGFTNKKIVYGNEFDAVSLQGQSAIRDLLESVQKNCRFFFLANYPQKIIDPIKSRCQTITLNEPPKDQLLKFCFKILKAENIEVKNKSGVVEIIKAHYPDIRQIVNTLQLNCVNGVFDTVKISTTSDVFENIFTYMKEADIENIRKTLRSEGVDYPALFNYLYEKAPEVKSPGDFVIALGEYLYRDAFVAIKEINFMAFYFEMMKKGVL
jgi:replication factor C small subunit